MPHALAVAAAKMHSESDLGEAGDHGIVSLNGALQTFLGVFAQRAHHFERGRIHVTREAGPCSSFNRSAPPPRAAPPRGGPSPCCRVGVVPKTHKWRPPPWETPSPSSPRRGAVISRWT